MIARFYEYSDVDMVGKSGLWAMYDEQLTTDSTVHETSKSMSTFRKFGEISKQRSRNSGTKLSKNLNLETRYSK